VPVYQILSKSVISLRYDDLKIFKLVAVRHLEFLKLYLFAVCLLFTMYYVFTLRQKIRRKSVTALPSYGQIYVLITCTLYRCTFSWESVTNVI